MPPIGRQLHVSERGPRPPARGRSGATAIAVTTIIAVLAVVVVVLSYRVAGSQNGADSKDVSALEARIDVLAGQVDGLQTGVRQAARDARASLTAAKRTPTQHAQPALTACLAQIQREIDDLQAYLAYRTPPRRDRVSGACLRLLQPRFKG